MNFLVRKYLLEHNLKLTAITLAEEVKLPRAWDEISAHLQEPPSLSKILQYYYSAGAQKAALEYAKDPSLKDQLASTQRVCVFYYFFWLFWGFFLSSHLNPGTRESWGDECTSPIGKC